MIKVLVVDDNELIRKSLIKRIDWEGLGLTCAGEAADGAQAYEKIKELHPSIVITDVRMPIADGFYTIDRCRASCPEVQFIIISGYDDFPYVKKALQRDVVDYILKPIDTEELHSTLEKARERIRQNQLHAQTQSKTHEYQRYYQEQRVANSFLSFFSRKIDYMDLLEQLEQADYPINKAFCACVCINFRAPHGDAVRTLSASQITETERQLESLYLNSTCKLLHIYHNIYCVACTYREKICCPEAVQGQMYAMVTQALASAGEIFLAFSKVLPAGQLQEAYRQSMRQMLKRFAEPENHLIGAEDELPHGTQASWQPLLDNLEVALDLQMKEECKSILRRLGERTKQQPALLQECWPKVFLSVDQKIGNQLSIHGFDPSFQQFYALRFFDLAQIVQTLCRLIDAVPPANAAEDIGEKVLAYIDRHFTKPLTLRSLGMLFHVNSIYLGQLLKKKTGILFNAYLNQLRIEKAKELIRTDPDLRLKDLAYSMGYTDSHYFTKVFKQLAGATPTEYRERYMGKDGGPLE